MKKFVIILLACIFSFNDAASIQEPYESSVQLSQVPLTPEQQKGFLSTLAGVAAGSLIFGKRDLSDIQLDQLTPEQQKGFLTGLALGIFGKRDLSDIQLDQLTPEQQKNFWGNFANCAVSSIGKRDLSDVQLDQLTPEQKKNLWGTLAGCAVSSIKKRTVELTQGQAISTFGNILDHLANKYA